MSLEGNKTGMEFETMLRRHLKNSGAAVVACSGFDADTASVYLEGVLGSAARARFESHLSGCSSCRRHIIELTRLSQMTSQSVAAVSAAPANAGWWERWKLAAAQNLENWPGFSWNRRLAGTGLAVCVLLMAAMVTRPWRQGVAPEANQAIPMQAAVSSEISQTPQPIASDELKSQIDPASQQPAQSAAKQYVPAPKLQVVPARDTESDERTLARKEAEPLRQLVVTDEARPSLSIPTGFSQSVSALTSEITATPGAIRTVADVPPPPLQKAPVEPEFAPKPDDNPMRRAKKSEEKSSAGKASAVPRQLGFYDSVLSFLPSRKSDSNAKPSVAVKDDETVSSLIRKFRDKTFRYERRMWIDQAYKPEIMAWRVKRLIRGSREYERLLAEEPALKEIFSFGPVIVVWGDKVYRVSQ